MNEKTLLGKIISLGTIPFYSLMLFLFVVWSIITHAIFGDGWVQLLVYFLGCCLYGFYIVGPRLFTIDDRSLDD